MEIKLKPLDGKYYGTDIEIKIPSENRKGVLNFSMGHGRPSKRELERCGITREQYNNSKDPTHDFGLDGSHMESQLTYRVAVMIVRAVKLYNRLHKFFK